MLKNCDECNRVFSHPTRVLCQECYDQALRSYGAVRDYLKANPGATVAEVAKDTDTTVEVIYEYIRQGRLDVVPKDARLYCAICGTSIDKGKVCASCRNDLRNTMTQEASKPEGKSKSSLRVHTAEHIRKQR